MKPSSEDTEALRRCVKHELDPDERIVWTGDRVSSGFGEFGGMAIGMGALWLGLVCIAAALLWRVAVGGSGGGWPSWLIVLIPLFMIGAVILMGGLGSYESAPPTAYVVTNSRAFAIERLRNSCRIRNFHPRELQRVSRRKSARGGWDLVFRIVVRTSFGMEDTRQVFGFLGIVDVETAEQKIEEIAARDRQPRVGESMSPSQPSRPAEGTPTLWASANDDTPPPPDDARFHGLKMGELPATLRAVLEGALQEGEWLEWIGMPEARSRGFALVNAFGFFVIGVPCFTIGLGSMALGGGAMFILLVMGFFVMGVTYSLWSMYRSAVYAITNRRALVYEPVWSKKVSSVWPREMTKAHRVERKDGTSDLILTESARPGEIGHRDDATLRFSRLRDPLPAQRALRRLIEAARS